MNDKQDHSNHSGWTVFSLHFSHGNQKESPGEREMSEDYEWQKRWFSSLGSHVHPSQQKDNREEQLLKMKAPFDSEMALLNGEKHVTFCRCSYRVHSTPKQGVLQECHSGNKVNCQITKYPCLCAKAWNLWAMAPMSSLRDCISELNIIHC